MNIVLSFLLFLGCAASVAGAEAPLRFAEKKADSGPIPAFEKGAFMPMDREVIVWIGGENSVIEQEHGWIEAHLVTALQRQGKSATVRHMGWEGDTVYRQNRMENWGSWLDNLAAVDATTVFVWFGGMEALRTDKSTTEFIAAYEKLLDELTRRTRRIVLVSPAPFEKPVSDSVPNQTPKNAALEEYVNAMKALAARRDCVFVDLFSSGASQSPLTRNGVHLTANGLREIAPVFLKALGLTPSEVGDGVRTAIMEKNRIWFDTWRPMNWAFAYGDRTTQPFAQAVADRPPFVEELKKGRPLINYWDATIHALLTGASLPAKLPEEPPRSDPPALSPDEQKGHFKLRDGFEIGLFAGEKNGVVRPIQIRWDERGRLWVVCAPSYPHLQPGEKANDFILVLEDTDGDGRADKSFRWAENLKMPMGLEFGSDGVFVCESTQLIYLRDTDGDGRADERSVLLSGFGTGDSHQNANSIRWGADGHLWFTQGYHIWSYVETPRGIVELNRSGVWRLNPRTMKLESFLNESAAGLNCWGVTFDDHGQVFHGSGADFSIWHTTPALIPTLHPLGLGAGFARSRGKSMEPEFLGSSHLPDDLQGVLLKSIYFTSQVGLYRLRDDGAGFASEDLGDLISSSGPEFRPLETRVGPDGAIYICDWLNPVIGHYQASYRDPRRDRSHGRIWRMTARDRKLLPRPILEKMNARELIAQLHSPERWNRDRAKFLLYRKDKAAVVGAVREAIGKDPDREPFLYELSGVLAAHEAPEPKLVERFLSSPDFRWRAWGTRLVGLWSDRLVDPLAYLSKATADPHPRVRMESVVAASTVPSGEALKVATLVLDEPMDPSIEHSLTLCIHHLAPYWRAEMAAGKLDFGGRFHALARVLSTAGDTNVVAQMRTILQSGKVAGDAREKLLAVLIEFGNDEDARFVFREMPEAQPVLDALVAVAERRGRRADGAIARQLLHSSSPRARMAGCRIAAAAGEAGQISRISQLISSPEPPEVRQAAVLALARLKGRDAWGEILPSARDAIPSVRQAAFTALARLDVEGAAKEGARLLADVVSPTDAGVVLAPLVRQKNGPTLLARAIESVALTSEAGRIGLQWLAQNGRDDPALVRAFRSAAEVQTSHLEFSEERVRRLVTDALKSGDAISGAKLIRSPELSCLGCHRIGAEGNLALGPDLSVIGRAMTPETIVESVLWPKRQVKEGFLLTQIVMKDGTQWHGFKTSESRAELRLRGVDAFETVLQKPDIQQRSDVGTLMPDGLTDALNDQERLDLLRYLMDLGK